MSSIIHLPGYTVTIGGVSQHLEGCWELLNGHRFRDPAPKRGSNEQVLGAEGTEPQERWPDERKLDLEYEFGGELDPDGLPYDNERQGLALNIAAFNEQIVEAPGDATSRLAVEVVEDATGRVLTGYLQVERFETDDDLTATSGVLSVTLHRGRLTESGS